MYICIYIYIQIYDVYYIHIHTRLAFRILSKWTLSKTVQTSIRTVAESILEPTRVGQMRDTLEQGQNKLWFRTRVAHLDVTTLEPKADFFCVSERNKLLLCIINVGILKKSSDSVWAWAHLRASRLVSTKCSLFFENQQMYYAKPHADKSGSNAWYMRKSAKQVVISYERVAHIDVATLERNHCCLSKVNNVSQVGHSLLECVNLAVRSFYYLFSKTNCGRS